jgi:hypothetical protein
MGERSSPSSALHGEVHQPGQEHTNEEDVRRKDWHFM